MGNLVQLPEAAWPTQYHFDPQTKEYRGSQVAEIDALASQRLKALVFIEPAHTTEVAPPSVPKGSAAVWSRTAWDVVPDHRGEVWYRGQEPVQITALGDPAVIDPNLSKEPTKSAPSPDQAKAARRAELVQQLQETGSRLAIYSIPVQSPLAGATKDTAERDQAEVARLLKQRADLADELNRFDQAS